MYLALKTNAPDATTRVLLSDHYDTGVKLLEGSDFGGIERQTNFSGSRGNLGAVATGDNLSNRNIALLLRQYCRDGQEQAELKDEMNQISEDLRRWGGRLTVKFNNQNYRVHFDILIGSLIEGQWDRRADILLNTEWSLVAVCAPFVEGDPYDFDESFTDNSTDQLYGFDAGAKSNVEFNSGLKGVANLTTENRLIRTEEGYDFGDAQGQIKFAVGSSQTAFKAGVILKRQGSTDYVECYVDESGGNNRLRIDTVQAGSRTNRATTNVTALSSGVAVWLKGRIEGDTIYAEYFTSEPMGITSPTSSVSYDTTGSSPVQQAFGKSSVGKTGVTFKAIHANAVISSLKFRPYTYYNKTLPSAISLYGSVPGSTHAKTDVKIAHSGGSSAPAFAMIAWDQRARAALSSSVAPFGLIAGEDASSATNWTSTSDANARGGYLLQDTVSGAESYSADWLIDPSAVDPDEFTRGEKFVEVWARVKVSSTLKSPTFVLSVKPEDGTGTGAVRYSSEYGSAGKQAVLPSSGTVYRMMRLGTLPLQVNAQAPRRWKLNVSASTLTSSSGSIGIDYLIICPIKSRASNPTGKALDSGYPQFMSLTTALTKTVKSDLTAEVAQGVKYGHPDAGLGGSVIELPKGDVDAIIKLSSTVPDDETSSTATEQLSHSASVHFAITPRFVLLRS